MNNAEIKAQKAEIKAQKAEIERLKNLLASGATLIFGRESDEKVDTVD